MNLRRSLTSAFATLPLVAFAMFGTTRALASVTLTGASGGTGISADTAATAASPSWTTLGPITIAEGANGDFAVGTNVTLILKTPAGFEFNPAVSPDIAFIANRNITSAAVVVTDAATVTITLTVAATTNADTLTIASATGLQVRPTAGTPLATGKHIYRPSTGGGTATITGISTSADGSNGSNFGNLTEVLGAPAAIRVETAANGSGSVVATQSITAGGSITVYAITRDAAGNFINNGPATAWSLVAETGGVADGDLVPAGNLKSAVFTAHLTGTAAIDATSGALTTTDSGTLTVVAGTASKMVFTTGPQALTAGVNSGTITVQIQDVGGNPINAVLFRTVNLSKTSATGLFRDTGDTTTITSVTIGIGTSSASFLYWDKLAGSPTLTAASSGLTSGMQIETVGAAAAALVRVETKADGSGTVVAAQNISAGNSITNYAITRDSFSNFVANVAADAWSLPTKTGGVADTDLTVASDGKSAVFMGRVLGTATIDAASGSLTATDSSTLTVVPGTATKLFVTLPGESFTANTGNSGTALAQTAGTAFTITRLTAVDNFTNIATSYAGSKTITYSGPGGTPAFTTPVSFTAGQSTTALTTTLLKAETTAITATAAGLSGAASSSLTVNTGPFAKLQLLAPGETAAPGTATGKTGSPSAQNAGTNFAVTVNAVDANWNFISGVSDTVAISSSDTNAALPTAAGLVNGTQNFTVTLNAAGNRTLTATDSSDGTKTANTSSSITVNAGAFVKLQLLLPGETASAGSATGKSGTPTALTAGTAFNLIVNGVDANWNLVTAASGSAYTMQVTASDPNATLPGTANLTSGTRTFSVTLKTAGTATITATDVDDGTKTPNTSPSLTVNPGALTKLQTLVPGESAAPGSATGKTGAPTAQSPGVAFNTTVNAVDANWNQINTNDTVHFTSTDANAGLPADTALVAGSQTISVTLNTAGSRTVTASDVTHAGITANTTAAITVSTGSFVKLQLLMPGETATPGTTNGKTGTPSAQTANTAFTVTVNSVDAQWNLVSTNHTVAISTSDVNATNPANAALVGGTKTFSVTFKTGGSQTVTATDVADGTKTPNTSPATTVNSGGLAKVQLLVPGELAAPGTPTGKTGSPLAQVINVPFTITVNGVDANWNLANTNDTIKILASDTNAVLPANAALVSGTRTFTVTLKNIGNSTVTASNLTHTAITGSTSPAITVTSPVAPLRGGPVVAIHDSELTRALETMTATNPGTPTGAGATGFEWWPTNWHYFVMPESLKEALRADGTAYEVVSDADISAGRLLTNGQPRYPILISLASEAVGDNEIGQLTNYVAAGGTLLAGSSAFTRQPSGAGRGDFALANQMGLHSASNGLQNWGANTTFTKSLAHGLTAHIPAGTLTWRLPTSADEISWGTSPAHALTAGTAAWQVQASDATVIAQGDGLPYLTVKAYGKGNFIYHAGMQPLIAHGGNGPGMYAYGIFRNAIESAFAGLKTPVVRVSPWPYPYDAAFAVRHDFEDYQSMISAIESSAQFESANGAKGDYYFCTGTLRVEMTNGPAVIASLQRAVTNYGATIGPHNGGLKNVNNTNLVVSGYDYWHWGPDEALDVTPAGYANGKTYATASVSNSFSDIETWLSGLTNGLRSTVAPYFNATRENSYALQEQLGVKTAGEQKLSPFPHWTLSTVTPGKRYSFLTLPVSDWYVSSELGQAIENNHDSASVHACVDYYYGLGALINLYSHSSSDGSGQAGGLVQDYITYGMSKPRIWPVNGATVYSWWTHRSATQLIPSFSTSNNFCIASVAVTGTNDPQTAVDFLMPKPFYTGLQVFTNGSAAPANAFRTNGQTIRVAVGATVTNAELRYFLSPNAQDDSYQVVSGATLTIPAPGVLANDSPGLGTSLSALVVSGPANGVVSLSTNGGFTYTPVTNFSGIDTFTYKANDGVADSAPATVTLSISPSLNALFSDDFTRGTDPGTLAPWVVQSGNWTISAGTLRGGANPIQSYGNLYLANNWTNYSVEARVQFPAGAYGGGLGARLNSSTGARYAAWIYPEGSLGGSSIMKLLKFQSWTAFGYFGVGQASMQLVSLPGVGTNWHTVKLALQGNQISVFYDQNQVINFTDTEAQTYASGGITLEMWTDNSGYVMNVDDVLVSGPTADQTITFNTPGNRTYGDAPFRPDAQASSGLPVSLSILSGPASIAGTNIVITGTGTVAIRASQSGNDSFKAAPAVDRSFTVNPATITITASSQSKMYGAALPAFAATYGGFVNGETSAVLSGTPSFSTSAQAGSSVGNYPITPALGSLTATNYSFAFVNGQLTITNAPLTVIANYASRAFGVTNPIFTATYSGFVNGDDPSVLSGTPAFASVAATNSLPGPYPISASAGSLTAANYSFTFVDGTLTVLPARLVFSDDFNRSTDPGPTAPWIVQSGLWNVTGGGLAGGTNNSFSYGFTYITNSWTDYSVEARVRFPSSAFGGGVGGRLNPTTGAHYAAWVYPEASAGGSRVLKLIKFSDWSNFSYNGVGLAPIQQIALTNVGTIWHSVQLTFSGTQISVYFDSTLMITATDTEAQPYTNGAVSLDMWTDAAGYVMNVDAVSVTTPLASQSITFAALPDKTYGNAPFPLSASASSGLPVNFTVFSGPATLSGSNLTITGAGNVTIRASQAGNASYLPAQNVDRAFTVNPAALTVGADSKSKVYGAADPALTYQIIGGFLIDTDSLSGTLARTAGEPAGTYAIGQGSLTAGANYSLTFNSANLTITPAALSVTADAKSKVYGAADPALTYQITSGTLVGSDSLSGSLSRAAGETVGNYAISQGTLSAGTNYALSFNAANLTITTAPLAVTADPKSKVYGAADQALTYQITSGALVGSDSFSGSLSREAGETVRSYAISQGTLTAGINYALTFNSANFTITPAALTVTADAKSKVYGTSDPALTYQITSGALVGSDSLSGSPSREAGETVGSYAINQGALIAGTNYSLTFSSANLAITTAALTVTADAKTKVYGLADPALTYQITSGALVGSDNLSGSLNRVAGETVGNYAINQGALTAGTNYSLSFNSANLAITAAALTVTADGKSKVYGAADPVLSYQITSGELVGSDSLSGTLSRVAGDTVGNYAINQGALTAGTNYSLTFNSANLVITTAALTVAADAESKVYGASEPALTYQITSGELVGSDSLSGSLSRVAGETVGSHTINQGSLTAGTNYALAFNSANLTITPAPLAATADTKTKVYGAADPSLTCQITSGALVGPDSLSGSLSRAAGESIGGYAINQGSLTAGTNYALTFNPANLTITTAALTVTADANSKVYGTADPVLTYQITSGALVGSDSLSGSLSRVAGETIGAYAINPGTLSAGTNYSLTFDTANLAITPAALAVSADPKSKAYGAADPALTYQITSGALVGGDSLSGLLGRVAGETVGSYAINQGALTAGTNYALTFTPANLSITPAALSVTADAKTKVYGAADPVLTYQLTSGTLVGSDSLSGSLSRVTGETVGNYTINQGTLAAGTNYSLAFTSANLSITPAVLAVTADAKTKVYGAADPALSYQITGGALVGSDSLSGLLSRVSGENVGGYAIHQGTVTAGTNYSLTFNSANLAITPHPLLVQADNQSRAYGTANPAFTVTYSGFVGADGVTNLSILPVAGTEAQPGSPIGMYDITLTGGTDTNYSLVLSNGTLTVTAAAVAITADATVKTYGAADPALTYQITGGALIGSDSLSGSLSRAAGETIGSYAIGQGSLTAGTNYSLTFNSANLSITPAALAVTADAKTKVYGAADPALTYQITSGALVGSDSLSGSLNRVTGETVGGYAIQQGSLTAGTNYALTFNSANLTITPAALTLAADAKSKVYGAVDPALTYQITSGALVSADSLSGSLTRVAGDAVGNYAINQGTLTAGTNYSLAFTSADLSITPAALAVTADAKTKVYGAADPALSYQITGGALVGSDSLSGSLNRMAGETIGSYAVNKGSLTAGTNYTLTFNSANLTITPAALAVTADTKTKVYGAVDPALTYQITSGALVGSDSFSGSLTRVVGETVGSYAIIQGSLTAGTNYELTFDSASLAIATAPLTVTADAKTKVYGTADPAMTYQLISGALVGSDSLSGSLSRVTGETIGDYAIQQGTLTAGTNYALTFNPANITITPAALTVAADEKSKVYGATDPAFTYQITGGALLGSDSFSGSLSRVAGETVGSHAISQGTLTAGTNYQLNYVAANLTITRAQSANTLASSLNPSIQGSNVTFTATLTPVAPATTTPTGSVQFLTDGAPLGSPVLLVGGVASFTTTLLPPGSNTITAAYPGDANFAGRTNALVQVVSATSQAPRTLGLKDNGDGTVTVNFAGTPGAQYIVQAASSLTPSIAWVNVSTNIAAPDGNWKITESIVGHPQRFYRAGRLDDAPPDPIVAQPPQDGGIRNNRDGTLTISFTGTPGAQYLIQAANSLFLPLNWVTVSTNTAGLNGQYSYTASLDDFLQRYYRSVIP